MANELTPTHSVLQELREESRSMEEGYRFLDEKRLILATEILRELGRYEQTRKRFDEQYAAAAASLRAAIERHGLDGVQVYPAVDGADAELKVRSRSVVGVPVYDARLSSQGNEPAAGGNASPEGERCRKMFAALIPQAAVLAGMVGNLERLRREYSRAARQARVLEDVLLPELKQTIQGLDSALEELERDEAVRLRWSGRGGDRNGAAKT